jgi:signal peptidase I
MKIWEIIMLKSMSWFKISIISITTITVFMVIIFRLILNRGIICGTCMEPTYHNGDTHLSWNQAYLFTKPKKLDVVVLRFPNQKRISMKRIVALENETVKFRNGKLIIDDREVNEEYVKYPCNWEISAVKISRDNVFVVGDNRSEHVEYKERGIFWEVPIKNIIGKVIQ